jgi:hypothetical protein
LIRGLDTAESHSTQETPGGVISGTCAMLPAAGQETSLALSDTLSVSLGATSEKGAIAVDLTLVPRPSGFCPTHDTYDDAHITVGGELAGRVKVALMLAAWRRSADAEEANLWAQIERDRAKCEASLVPCPSAQAYLTKVSCGNAKHREAANALIEGAQQRVRAQARISECVKDFFDNFRGDGAAQDIVEAGDASDSGCIELSRKRGLFGGTAFARFQDECKAAWANRYCTWRVDEIDAGRDPNSEVARQARALRWIQAQKNLSKVGPTVFPIARKVVLGLMKAPATTKFLSEEVFLSCPNHPIYFVSETTRSSNSFGVLLDGDACVAVHESGKKAAAMDCGQLHTAGIIAARGDLRILNRWCSTATLLFLQDIMPNLDSPRRSIWPWLVIVAVVVCIGCSLGNREGPLVTCSDLKDGQINACKEGIIARCDNGKIEYEVCTESTKDVSASELCEQPWQIKGQYSCVNADAGTGQ